MISSIMDRYYTWDTPEDGSEDAVRERACMGSALDYCEEAEELIRLSENIPNLIQDEVTAESFFERLIYVLNRYQEQPGLLDAHIEKLVTPCLARLRNTPDLVPPTRYIVYSCRFIFLLAKVRGTKSIIRWFPHEVSDLEPILLALEQQDPNNVGEWEVRFTLLLWLAMVCIVPFDISRFDTSQQRVSTMDRIIHIAKLYIGSKDKCRDATVLIIGRFLSRPDVSREKLDDYLEWSFVTLDKVFPNPSDGLSTICGILNALSTLYKLSKREEIVKYSPTVLERIKSLDLFSNKHTVVRKLNSKVLQRCGLSFLRARPAVWRYQRGSRSLIQALDPDKFKSQLEADKSTADALSTELRSSGTEDENFVPEGVDEVLELLLVGLSDRDTIVRWSAAKGLGRISSRLSQSNADDVVQSIFEFFSVRQSDSGWHGGCLALAELARRGVLLPERLKGVVPLVLEGLVYDEKRGFSSVGAHVRDAACFVCWAFARAYDPDLLRYYVNELAQALVNVSLFDREVNCRKAASAAFQESVGRLGTFPHGMELVTIMDYHAVSNKKDTYMDLSIQIAEIEAYRYTIIDELYLRKLLHWDVTIRELSAQALGKLVPFAPDYFTGKVLSVLIPHTLAIDLQERHGVLLGVGYIVHALSQLEGKHSIETTLGNERILQLQGIAKNLESAKMYRGLGGKVLRPAAMKFIEKMAMSDLPTTSEVLQVWRTSMDENLQDPHRSTQERAIEAFREVCAHCYQSLPADTLAPLLCGLVNNALEQLKSGVHFARMGFSLALGVLPYSFYQTEGNLEKIIHALIACAIHDDVNQAIYTEARRDAIVSISRICVTVGITRDDDSESAVNSKLLDEIYSCLFESLNNYSIDNRGDIGAVVREATMQVLVSLSQQVIAQHRHLFREEWCVHMVCGLIKQANEKIDRVRQVASSSLIALIHTSTGDTPYLPHLTELREIFPQDPNQLVIPAESFKVTVRAIKLNTYRKFVLSGLVISIGGVAESVIRAASSSLLEQIKDLSQDKELLDKFTVSLIEVYEDCIKQPRLIIPFLKMTDSLLTNACFEEYEGEPGSFPDQLFTITQSCTRRTKDVKRVLTSIDVFCGLLQFKGLVQTKVLSHLMDVLCHPAFPRARKIAAEQLHLTLVTYEELMSPEVVDEVSEILSDTPWNLSMEEITPSRDRLCKLLDLPIPALHTPVSVKAGGGQKESQDFTFNEFVQRPF